MTRIHDKRLAKRITKTELGDDMADLRMLQDDLDPRRWVGANALGDAPTAQGISTVAAAGIPPVREPVTSRADQQADASVG